MKPISFLGNSLECLREFPQDARHDADYTLDQVQRGKQPSDFKPVSMVGNGVSKSCGLGRREHLPRVYLARLKEAVYVLHAFQKKPRATSKQDIEIPRSRHTALMRGRR